MNRIIESPTKIAFLALVYGVLIFTAMGIVPAKDFLLLAGMGFTYYFTKNSGDNVGGKSE